MWVAVQKEYLKTNGKRHVVFGRLSMPVSDLDEARKLLLTWKTSMVAVELEKKVQWEPFDLPAKLTAIGNSLTVSKVTPADLKLAPATKVRPPRGYPTRYTKQLKASAAAMTDWVRKLLDVYPTAVVVGDCVIIPIPKETP